MFILEIKIRSLSSSLEEKTTCKSNAYMRREKKKKKKKKEIPYAQNVMARLIRVFKNWKLLFENICGNTCRCLKIFVEIRVGKKVCKNT